MTRLSTVNYSAIEVSKPVDMVAARGTFRSVDHLPRTLIQDCYGICPPIKKPDAGCAAKSGFIDFTGAVIGRLTVVGMAEKSVGVNKTSWVCRCQCGKYCTRRAKSLRDGLRNGNAFVDRCGLCDFNRKLATGEFTKYSTGAK